MTPPPGDDLLVWLREQLDEDERLARSVPVGPWTVDARLANYPAVLDADRCAVVVVDHGTPLEVAQHIARWNPARVLREVEAARVILAEVLSWRHRVVEDCWYTCPAATEERDGGECCNEDLSGCDCGTDRKQLVMLRALALPYSDRPRYRQEWAP